MSCYYVLANNLYGDAQGKPMPIRKFRWLENEEIDKLNFEEMSDDQKEGYILEVDLDYPSHLHRAHGSFPLAPERLHITPDMLSPYAQGNLSYQ